MPTLLSLPDDISIKSTLGESVLEAARRADVPIACACGGKAKCSTCRIWILDGADRCPERTAPERALVERLGLGNNVRLACQLRPDSDITFRRLVLDETDLRMTSQLLPHRSTSAGELKSVVIFFSDVAGFTHFSETLTPYDVMYLLNRYFTQVAEVIELNDGYIDKFVGDGLMAIFGVQGQDDAPVRAVNAALQTLATVDRLKPFFASMYGIDFDIRVGLHLGEAVIGSVGSPGNERLTAIGDAAHEMAGFLDPASFKHRARVQEHQPWRARQRRTGGKRAGLRRGFNIDEAAPGHVSHALDHPVVGAINQQHFPDQAAGRTRDQCGERGDRGLLDATRCDDDAQHGL